MDAFLGVSSILVAHIRYLLVGSPPVSYRRIYSSKKEQLYLYAEVFDLASSGAHEHNSRLKRMTEHNVIIEAFFTSAMEFI